MSDKATLIRRNCNNLADTLRALDLPADEILASARALESMWAPEDNAHLVVQRIWRAIIEHTGNPAMPMLCGTKVAFGVYEVIDYLTAATATVGEGLTQLARYFDIISTRMVWRVEPEGFPRKIFLRSLHGDRAVGHCFMQYTLGVTITRFYDSAEGDLSIERVELALPEPPDEEPYRALFRCPLSFGHDETLLLMSERCWQLPMKRREASLQRVLERHVQQLLASQTEQQAPLLRARVVVREALPQGPPRLVEVASKLAMSERTLQRRLREGGTSFQELVDGERHQVALDHIRNPRLSIGDVAYLLGYSESSAFVRAFKRWTGATPSAYRQQASPG